MRKILLSLLFLSITQNSIAQNAECRYEQIAFNYFIENVFLKDYQDGIFSCTGKVDNSAGYSNCMAAQEMIIGECNQIIVNESKMIRKKNGIWNRMFLSKSKRYEIVVFRRYSRKENIVVCVAIIGKIVDNFYTFEIEKRTDMVINQCKTRMRM